MRITHNLHFTGYRVEDFTKAAGTGRPFVTIDMDHEDRVSQATLYLYDPAECDELIKAAARARRLLTGKPALEAPTSYIAFGEPRTVCGARPYPAGSEGDDGTECRLPAGHDGPHDDVPDVPDEPRGEHPYPEVPDCDAMEFGGSPPSMLDGKCRCLVCGRCGHHTGNAHQGHYWAWCKATKTMREHHMCCPDPAFGCELEAAPTPMQRYSRQAHIAWHERTHPDAPEWPRQPLTDDEALAAIADYEGTGGQP